MLPRNNSTYVNSQDRNYHLYRGNCRNSWWLKFCCICISPTYLVLPDYFGNRFYQSLGNIETDPQVGLLFPDFTTGDVLYITGNAENLHDEEAEAIMPHVGLLTRIQVIGAAFVKEGLNLRMVSEEQYSPYNPPVQYL